MNPYGFALSYIIKCEYHHVLFSSAFLASPVALLSRMLTTFSKGKPEPGAMTGVFLLSFTVGALLHIFADQHGLGF